MPFLRGAISENACGVRSLACGGRRFLEVPRSVGLLMGVALLSAVRLLARAACFVRRTSALATEAAQPTEQSRHLVVLRVKWDSSSCSPRNDTLVSVVVINVIYGRRRRRLGVGGGGGRGFIQIKETR